MVDGSTASNPEQFDPSPPRSFDKLFKVLLHRYSKGIVEWLVGSPVRGVVALETSHPLVQMRSTDKLYEAHCETGPGVALHVEVQLEGRLKMPFRMAE